MLEELHIRGLGVIADATLELGPGLTVVTGETGAGKTMVLTGLRLVAGGKTDAALVRAGQERVSVEARWRLAPGSPARQRADEAGADVDEDDALVVARTIAAGGRSRAVAGGTGVPAQVLADISEHVLAVHGQHDQLRLLRPAEQRAALDRFAGPELAVVLEGYGQDHARWRQVVGELEDLTTRAQERAREADLLRAGLDRIAAVAPEIGEDERLRAEADRLTHAEELGGAAAVARSALAADDDGTGAADVMGLVAAARRALAPVTEHDPTLAALAARLADIAAAVSDVASDLASYAATVEGDPGRLADVQDRRAALATLTRLYGPGLPDVLAWAEDAEPRLLALDDDDERRAALAAERDGLRARLEHAAAALGELRRRAADRFAVAVSEELSALAMPHAEVHADVTDTGELGPLGRDAVELQLVPHPGSPPRPLAKGASGGELSRVMLAVEVVLATLGEGAGEGAGDGGLTLVFDEVDAGVGGRAAVEVGRRLARLARGRQVLVVTHLPQVAAFADRHLLVRRDDDGVVTASDVVALTDAERVVELSRMLAGLDSALAQGHAEELLALARSECT